MSQTKVLTNEVLKGIMTDAMVYRGSNPDLDTALTAGVFQITGKNIIPTLYQYGILRVMEAGEFVSQEYIPHRTTLDTPADWASAYVGCYARRTHYNGEWSPWIIFRGELGA